MSIHASTLTPTAPLILPVDAEHGGIRAVVLATFIAAWFIGFGISSMVIASDGLNLIAILIGFAAGALVAIPLENVLKKRWPSGRVVKIESTGIQIENRGKLEEHILSEDPAQTILWRFQVNKRSRIPKGWTMLACALECEGRYLVAYTFISPDKLKTFDGVERFKKLISRKDNLGQKDMREDMRLAGEQRRLRDAEAHRWMDGAEMSADHFQTYLSTLETRFSEWMPLK